MARAPLANFEGEIYDVVVVGGGAVGCASARELAGRGYRTLLVERADIGSGTSSRSSRMLYSGVGYLAPHFPLWQIPFRLHELWNQFVYARNIMHCRAELVRDMPHRLTKHRFQYPFRKGDQYPHWLVDLGFRLMEKVASRGVPLAYRKISSRQAAQESQMVAGLSAPISSVAVFEEYMYDWPERICMDTALDAERRGATIRTYTQVAGIKRNDSMWALTLDDQAPGSSGQARVKAKMIVNAAGPWVDRVPGGVSGHTKRVVGKKGVNVMVRLPDSWKGQGLEAFSSKGEPFYVFPWGDHHFVGPTETVVSENPDNVQVLDSEIEYILNETNLLFPQLKLTRDDVRHSWCGVRPMSTTDGENVSLPVRAIEDPNLPNMVTMTGSYIMMHRHAGRLAATSVEKSLGKRNAAPKGMLVGPSIAQNDEDIIRIIKTEHVVTLTDLIRRRLPEGLNPSTLGRDKAQHLSKIAANTLGWTEEKREQELQRFVSDTARIYH
ncbi:FAD-dependent oxidoreductase [Pseudomonas sp. WHRI 8519]|uniref:FAD-dependent oxidoreductase n=1 Tax=Pseudomonas sp. WHRI 8519 TaxID=3162567 RepID=UPI0032EE299D